MQTQTAFEKVANQVDPWGRRHARQGDFVRGALMGNRGVLAAAPSDRRQDWKGMAWVNCLLQMPEGRAPAPTGLKYTKLFFLDEATALAAGHRPCWYCQREQHEAFKRQWLQAADLPPQSLISVLDAALQAERIAPGTRHKHRHDARLSDLPPGTMFEWADHAVLVWRNGLHRWSFEGYTPHSPLAGDTRVKVLTPASIVPMLAAGWPLQVHPSAEALQAPP